MKYLISIILLALMPLIAAGDVGAEDGDIANWGAVAIRSNGDIDGVAGFTVSTESEITAVDSDVSSYQKAVVSISDYALVMTTTTGSDTHGTVKIADFPEGYIEVTGIHCDLTMANTETGVAATTTYDVGLGSTETDGSTGGVLDTASEYDYLGKIEGSLSSYTADVESQSITDVGTDGTATAADMWLNVAYEDADVTGETTNTVSGTVTFYWRNLGDD